jgi:signal transduction histidine kinase
LQTLALSEFLIQATRVTYIVLGLITLIDLIRWRDRARLDIALLFVTLALIVILQEFIALGSAQAFWLAKFNQLALMAHPYLLLQLVEHFRPVPRWVRWFGGLGLLASWAVLLILPVSPPLVSIALVIYFVAIEVYAAADLAQGAWVTRGVTRWRLSLAALGSGLIATVLLFAGFNVVAPFLAPYLALFTQALGVLSGLAYYFGFAPPRWLRRAWQLNELYDFLHEAAGQPVAIRGQETLAHLCTKANAAVGGRAAVAALWDSGKQQLVIQNSTNRALTGTLSAQQGATGKAWQTRQSAFVRTDDAFAPESQRLAKILEAHSLIAVPIGTVDRAWGLLVVLMQRVPLFPNDDMDLLALFAEQSALALEQLELLNEQKTLLNEQQTLVQELQERTTQLEESNQELESFSYSVSHDLRAPLRHIEGFTEFLVKANIAANDEKSRRHLTLISEAARRMGVLIDNLLTFSRLGRAALTLTPVDLNNVLEEARRDLQVEAEGRDIAWQVEPLPRVYGDAGLLRLVLVNLLSNALKYTRSRQHVQIQIGSLAEQGRTDQPETATIFVRDNGVGFDMQYTDKLFGVFQRLHHADEFEGTGIGLANVRRIVNRHGGRAWAESVLNEGATFYFSLPTGPAPGFAALPFSTQSPKPTPVPFTLAALSTTTNQSDRPLNRPLH